MGAGPTVSDSPKPFRWRPRVRPEDLPDAYHARVRALQEESKASKAEPISKTKETTMPRKATKKATPKARAKQPPRPVARKRRVKITATGSGPLIDPDTGRAYKPMSRSELLQAMQGRQWAGDAADTLFSPCARCGGACGKSAVYSAPWRVHRVCHRISTHQGRIRAAVAELLGTEITFTNAGLIASKVAVPSYSDLPNAQPHTEPGRAWGHVDKRKLRKALRSLAALRAEHGLTPRPCMDGPCAWCSIQRATGWQTFGHKWADGSAAPLCGACSGVMETYGNSPVEPVWIEDYSTQRRLAWSGLTGTAPRLGNNPAPSGYRAYAEVAPADHAGHDERGGYIAPEQRPGTVEFAERIEREHAEAAAVSEQRRAEQAEAERQQRERWGFEVTK